MSHPPSELLRRRSRTAIAILLAVSAGLLPVAGGGVAPAGAGGLRDLDDGWLIPAGELIERLWPPLEPSPGSVGIGGRRPSARRIWLGHARLFGLAELPISAVGLELPALGLQWSLQWQRLGETLLQEDQWRLALLRPSRFTPQVTVGWDRLALAGSPSSGQLFLSVGLTLRLATGLRLRLEPPLTSPPSWYGPTAARRWLLLTGGFDGVAAALAVDRTSAGSPIVQLDLAGRIAPRVALGLRAEPVTGSIGLTTAWRYSHWLLRTAHLVHPQLGVTHRWYLSAGNLGASH